MTAILSVVFIFLLFGVCFAAFAWYMGSRIDEEQSEAVAVPKAESVKLEHYVTGLPSCDRGAADVECRVICDHFVFSSFFGNELGRIPRDSVNEIFVEDKTTVTQRLTVTRMLTLGVFALAVPKTSTHSEYCLVIDWHDQGGARQNTLFLFTGPGSMSTAHKAANYLRRHCSERPAQGMLCQQPV